MVKLLFFAAFFLSIYHSTCLVVKTSIDGAENGKFFKPATELNKVSSGSERKESFLFDIASPFLEDSDADKSLIKKRSLRNKVYVSGKRKSSTYQNQELPTQVPPQEQEAQTEAPPQAENPPDQQPQEDAAPAPSPAVVFQSTTEPPEVDESGSGSGFVEETSTTTTVPPQQPPMPPSDMPVVGQPPPIPNGPSMVQPPPATTVQTNPPYPPNPAPPVPPIQPYPTTTTISPYSNYGVQNPAQYQPAPAVPQGYPPIMTRKVHNFYKGHKKSSSAASLRRKTKTADHKARKVAAVQKSHGPSAPVHQNPKTRHSKYLKPHHNQKAS